MEPNRRILPLLVVAGVLVGACGGGESVEPTQGAVTSPPTTATTAVSTTTTKPTTTSSEASIGASTEPTVVESGIGEPIHLDSYAAAWGSGDADQIRAFYTEDAVILPLHVLRQLAGGYSPVVWEVAGADLDREAREHDGGTLEIDDPVRVGNIAAFSYRFTVGEIVITGAVIQHYEGDLIWREFLDAELSWKQDD